MTALPAREPINDAFAGVLLRYEGQVILASQPITGADVLARGVIVRYGARMLEKPSLSLVPELIALERGQIMTGERAWEFLLRRSNLYPRTEVYGHLDDGTDIMKTVKWLDLALTPKVLAYADAAQTTPLAEVTALVGPAADFPARAVDYLPRHDLPAQRHP